MAWTDCKCAECGADLRVQLYGPHKQREWEAEHQYCDDCKTKYVVKKREAEAAKAKEATDDLVFCELQGSEKQIAWADTIRRKQAAVLKELYTKSNQKTDDPRKVKLLAQAKIEAMNLFTQEPSARVIIDGRDRNPIEELKKICTELIKKHPDAEQKTTVWQGREIEYYDLKIGEVNNDN